MKSKLFGIIVLILFSFNHSSFSQTHRNILNYNVEIGVQTGNGTFSPLWFTTNRYGLVNNESNSAYLKAGFTYHKLLKKNWHIQAGMDLTGGINQISSVYLQQFYIDFDWKKLNLSLGLKERTGFPLTKNKRLSSGMLVEGANTRPVPQVRAEIADFLNIPGTKGWLAFKGH